MSASREQINNAYDLLLGRRPENDHMVKEYIDGLTDIFQLVDQILSSDEYNDNYCKARLANIASTNALTERLFILLLNRPADPGELRDAAKHKSLLELHRYIFDHPEYISLAKRRVYIARSELKLARLNESYGHIPKLIYLHIPKTAGKAFEFLLEKNYPEDTSLSTSRIINKNRWLNSRVIGGHEPYSEYRLMENKKLYIGIVRDPVERALSRFNYYRSIKGPSFSQREAKGFDHENLLTTIENSNFRTEFVDNYQCRFLSGKPNFRSVKHAFGQDDFIIGSLEHISEFTKFLSQRLQWPITDLPVINNASNREYVEELKADRALVRKLRWLNRQDQKLHRFIEEKGVYTSCRPDYDFRPFFPKNITQPV